MREYERMAFKDETLAHWLPSPGQAVTPAPCIPRVLVCGAMGAGKSTLINLYVEGGMVSHTASPCSENNTDKRTYTGCCGSWVTIYGS